MLRAIIIDDEEIGIESLKLLIERFVSDVKIVTVTTEANNGVRLIEDYRPEIVFLDINMPYLNGFDSLTVWASSERHLVGFANPKDVPVTLSGAGLYSRLGDLCKPDLSAFAEATEQAA